MGSLAGRKLFREDERSDGGRMEQGRLAGDTLVTVQRSFETVETPGL